MNAAHALEQARPVLRVLVDRAENSTGSRMTAYDAVARELKASGSWLRKALGNQPVAFPAHVYLNMVKAYEAACARMEAEAAVERERFRALGRSSDALAEGVAGPRNAPAGEQPRGASETSALVAAMVGEVGR